MISKSRLRELIAEVLDENCSTFRGPRGHRGVMGPRGMEGITGGTGYTGPTGGGGSLSSSTSQNLKKSPVKTIYREGPKVTRKPSTNPAMERIKKMRESRQNMKREKRERREKVGTDPVAFMGFNGQVYNAVSKAAPESGDTMGQGVSVDTDIMVCTGRNTVHIFDYNDITSTWDLIYSIHNGAANINNIVIRGDNLYMSIFDNDGAYVWLYEKGVSWDLNREPDVSLDIPIELGDGSFMAIDETESYIALMNFATHVFIFEKSGGVWGNVPVGIDLVAYGATGRKPVFNGSQLIIPIAENPAKALIYERVDGTWTLITTLNVSSANSYNATTHGDTIVICGGDEATSDIFYRTGGVWSTEPDDQITDPYGVWMGEFPSMQENVISMDVYNGFGLGEVQVFVKEEGVWTCPERALYKITTGGLILGACTSFGDVFYYGVYNGPIGYTFFFQECLNTDGLVVPEITADGDVVNFIKPLKLNKLISGSPSVDYDNLDETTNTDSGVYATVGTVPITVPIHEQMVFVSNVVDFQPGGLVCVIATFMASADSGSVTGSFYVGSDYGSGPIKKVDFPTANISIPISVQALLNVPRGDEYDFHLYFKPDSGFGLTVSTGLIIGFLPV